MTTILLMPGFWLDASAWDAVVPLLREAGHDPIALTPAGMDADPEVRRATTLADQVEALIDAIDDLEGDLVLVGHSGGGPVVYGALDARPDRVRHIVYVDTTPGGEGSVINDELPVVDGEIPLPAWDVLGDDMLRGFDEAGLESLRASAIPEPVRVAQDPLRLSGDAAVRRAVPTTMVCCEMPAAAIREVMDPAHPWHGYAAELATLTALELVDLPTGHWPMLTAPAELAVILARAAN